MVSQKSPELKSLSGGEWIAFTADGIIAHHRSCAAMHAQIDPKITEFIIDRIHEYEFVEPMRFYGVRFKSLKRHEWSPKYPVLLNSTSVEMLVDSGADMSLVCYELGKALGFTKSASEPCETAMGVGGEVEFLIRQVEMSIDNKTFLARVAWLQSDIDTDNLLGRETVFDIFNIEFKQVDEEIVFRSHDQTSTL
jgi:hypothetical protein